MIGLDTNILVRILTADDPVQTQQAVSLLRERCSPDAPGYVNCVVLTELIWVMQASYGYSRALIADAVERLLANDSLLIEQHDEMAVAVAIYKATNCDFDDAMIVQINRARGCLATATFDRKAAKLDGFTLV